MKNGRLRNVRNTNDDIHARARYAEGRDRRARADAGGHVAGGSLRAVPVEDLAATAVKAVIERTGIDPELVDDVSFAQSYVNGETPCIGRWAALHAGPAGKRARPADRPALRRRAAGGHHGGHDGADPARPTWSLAGGAESMSNAEHYHHLRPLGCQGRPNQVLYDRIDRGRERSQPEWRFGKISGMIETAENLAAKLRHHQGRGGGLPAAPRSQQRAAAAWEAGRFRRRGGADPGARSGAATRSDGQPGRGRAARHHPQDPR